MREPDRHYHVFETTAGWSAIAWASNSVVRFVLPNTSEAGAERQLLGRLPHASRAVPPEEIDGIIAAARKYFAGEQMHFSGVAIDLAGQDRFFIGVYDIVRRLAWGETTTYGAIAKALGAGPEAARDVGRAMAGNPVPLIIPCHRVLAAGSRIGGFSAPGGSDTKRRMLEMEGVQLAPPKPVQQSLAF
ncbi:MAG: methylated-DNA--[protein]-cysteine S-methyltransferase [Rhizobium sp.]|nr:methylated-DNA--[protein]-cysteine S-methyltransferase [Rhizobium sp.]